MGNTLTKTNTTDTWAYMYDKQNRLTQVGKNQEVIAQYVYDGNGRRIQKTELVEPLQEYHDTIYVYSGLRIFYEENITTGQHATYVYGPVGMIAKKVGGSTDYYHTDHLGSTRLITDESGSAVTEVMYEPYGGSTVTGEVDTHLYNGKEQDSTGLYYYGARYYDAQMGRFITRDPRFGRLGNPQTLNRYVYVLNDPLKYIDPTGHGENMGYLYDLDEREPIPIDWGAVKEDILSFINDLETRWDELHLKTKVGLVLGFISLLIGLTLFAQHLALLVAADGIYGLLTGATLAQVIVAGLLVLVYIIEIFINLLDIVKTTEGLKENPWGTGNVDVTETQKLHRNGRKAEVIWETSGGDVIRHEYFDEFGNRIWGFKWEGGRYLVWVLNNPENPAEGGNWEETDPPGTGGF